MEPDLKPDGDEAVSITITAAAEPSSAAQDTTAPTVAPAPQPARTKPSSQTEPAPQPLPSSAHAATHAQQLQHAPTGKITAEVPVPDGSAFHWFVRWAHTQCIAFCVLC